MCQVPPCPRWLCCHRRYNYQKLQAMTLAAPKPMTDDEKALAETEVVPLKAADTSGKPSSS